MIENWRILVSRLDIISEDKRSRSALWVKHRSRNIYESYRGGSPSLSLSQNITHTLSISTNTFACYFDTSKEWICHKSVYISLSFSQDRQSRYCTQSRSAPLATRKVTSSWNIRFYLSETPNENCAIWMPYHVYITKVLDWNLLHDVTAHVMRVM